ncbi:MAG: AMP-binding protein, partial [Acidobacteriota bacterium]
GAIVTVGTYRRGGRDIDLYSKVKEARAPLAVVISDPDDPSIELRPTDLSWDDFLGPQTPFPSRPREPGAVTNVLFSSGTTGDPKAIPWTQLTPLKCAMDGYFHQDIRPGDVVAWQTNIGWMMGPWLIYAALINRATIALHEGLPSGPEFARFIEEAGVTMLGVVPSLVRSWRDSGACDDADWTGIRVFSSTGEPSSREDYLWLMSQTGYRAPVIEYCGGTEIGGGYITGTVVQPCSPATFTTPALGLDFVALGDDGQQVSEGDDGEIFLVPPSIGLSEALLNGNHDEVYHQDCPSGPNGEALRRHGDQLRRLPRGFWRAQGRADDTMNLGGIKVSSKELERVIENHPAVFETAAVAVQPSGEGAEKLIVFVHPSHTTVPDGLRGQLQKEITTHLNPLFRIEALVVTDDLPRTASGKLMRRVLRDRYLESVDRH